MTDALTIAAPEMLPRHPVSHRQEFLLRDPRCQIAEYRPDKLLTLVRMAERLGISTTSWFSGLAIDREQLTDPGLRIAYRTAHQFFTRALAQMDLPNPGLIVGGHGDIGDFGLLGLAILTSGTLGEALSAAMEHYRVCGCLLDLSLIPVSEGVLALEARQPMNDADLEPYYCDELFASCVSIARKLVGDSFKPLRLELRYPEPAQANQHSALFQCPIRFGSNANRLLIDMRWLGFPLPGHNPLTARQALALCAERMTPAERGKGPQEIVVTVERLLRERVHQPVRMADIAQLLYTSERSLRRRLADNGLVFRDLHDRVRAEYAMELLREARLPIAEIGARVGFHDAREFRRAFKRWTGMAPTVARSSARQSGQGGRFASDDHSPTVHAA